MQHERTGSVPVVHKPYHVDTLGAPFKVVLNNGVTFGIDEKTGEETVSIPDTIGLINAVVRKRVQHTRKLNGEELRFIRKAIGVRAKSLAELLDISPEHYSRCENGDKLMSSQSEKTLRLFAYVATFYSDPETELLAKNQIVPSTDDVPPEMAKEAANFIKWFLSLKIRSVYPNEELCFEFWRGRHQAGVSEDNDGDDDKWSGGDCRIAA
jgi:transcriptional regulator with XRE-family HTH domain